MKIIRVTTKSSKISVQSIMKNLEIRKSLIKMFKDIFFKKRTVEERSI